ncbi:hypothetical protein JCM3765_006097 [Sporobolomyces pararoseus]
MKCTTSTSSLGLLLALPVALAGLFDSPKPLLAFSHPESFRGLKEEFNKQIDTVAFLPGFHPCGTLTILALDDYSDSTSQHLHSLNFDDFEILPRSNRTTKEDEGEGEGKPERRKFTMDYFEEARDSVLESHGLEGTVLAWSKGWRNTCGRGAINKQVKVIKVSTKDLLGKPGISRQNYLEQLDARVTPHLENLEPSPHNNLVIVTPVSTSTQLLLFDVATPSKPLPPPEWKIEYPARRTRERGFFERILARIIDFLILSAAGFGLFSLGKCGWNKYQEKKGKIRLPFTRDDDLDLEAE